MATTPAMGRVSRRAFVGICLIALFVNNFFNAIKKHLDLFSVNKAIDCSKLMLSFAVKSNHRSISVWLNCFAAEEVICD